MTKAVIPEYLGKAQQIIIVLTEDWHSFHSRLYLGERKNGAWQVINCFPAVCGRAGLAWGLGLYPQNPAVQPQPAKVEGDQKTPAGIFRLGKCLGYAPQLTVNLDLPYQQLTKDFQGVDDPASRYYNQVVDTAQLRKDVAIDWKSYEIMRRDDELYKWLLVIEHNPENLPGAGSLIFMHIWENQDQATAGCTGVAEASLLELLGWLDRSANPVLVQLPQEIYNEKLSEWGLPLL